MVDSTEIRNVAIVFMGSERLAPGRPRIHPETSWNMNKKGVEGLIERAKIFR